MFFHAAKCRNVEQAIKCRTKPNPKIQQNPLKAERVFVFGNNLFCGARDRNRTGTLVLRSDGF